MYLASINIKSSYLFSVLLAVTLSFTFAACEGPAGPEGPQGAQGPEGPQGAVGPAGEDGSQIYSGTGAPDAEIGAVGDYYLDTETGELYGPKEESGWGSPSIVLMGEDGQDGTDGADGKDGADGADGADGSQIYSGTGAPDASLGVEGDYYLDKSSYELYGPKTAGGWGSPLNLKGADGNANVTLYIFDPDPFTSTDPQHTFEISGLDFTDIYESSWDFAFKRGLLKQFIPGTLPFGSPPSEFTVYLFYDTNTGNVQFTVELVNGSDYYPDELHIFKVASSNVVNAKHNTNSPLRMEPSRINDYEALIDFYGEEHIKIVDMR